MDCGQIPAPAAVRSELKARFGYPGFRVGQEELVLASLRGRDALGVLPTGGGKSICYQLPSVLLPGLTLVISPLISLMEDQVMRARQAGIAAAFLNSTLSFKRAAQVQREVADGTLKLLFVAPERLQVESFRRVLERVEVSLIGVDEAHCISTWGHDFRPSYRRLGALRNWLSAPVMALTATATPRVRKDIEVSLRLRDPVRVIGGFDRPNLHWKVISARGHGEKVREIKRLALLAGGPVVVYAGTRRTVEAIRDQIASTGRPTDAYHAGLSAEERQRVQEAFMTEDRCVVATNAFGMGVDKANVRLVAHYQLPATLEDYYQEAGRAGRDGASARCVALYHRTDEHLHRRLLDGARPSVRTMRTVLRKLRQRLGPGGRGRVSLDEMSEERTDLPPDQLLEVIRTLARHRVILALEPFPETLPSAEDSRRLSLGVFRNRPNLDAAAELRAHALAKLKSVGRYARTRHCRRTVLLGYFGEQNSSVGCGNCDRCRAG